MLLEKYEGNCKLVFRITYGNSIQETGHVWFGIIENPSLNRLLISMIPSHMTTPQSFFP